MGGRKRHVVVDTLGLIHAVVVHAANVQDRDGAKLVLAEARAQHPAPAVVWADAGYGGQLEEWVAETCGWRLEIVRKDPAQRGFQVLPKRWIVERTFAWLGRWRRLSKDYEATVASSRAFLQVAMIALMLRRLTT